MIVWWKSAFYFAIIWEILLFDFTIIWQNSDFILGSFGENLGLISRCLKKILIFSWDQFIKIAVLPVIIWWKVVYLYPTTIQNCFFFLQPTDKFLNCFSQVLTEKFPDMFLSPIDGLLCIIFLAKMTKTWYFSCGWMAKFMLLLLWMIIKFCVFKSSQIDHHFFFSFFFFQCLTERFCNSSL